MLDEYGFGTSIDTQFGAVGIKIQGNSPRFTEIDALVATGNMVHMGRFNAGRTVNFLRILRTVNFLLVPKGGRLKARSKRVLLR